VKDLILTGARIGGKEAAELGIVDGAFSEAELFPRTMDFARKMAEKDRETYTKIKHNWRRRIATLRDVVMGGK
jgi:enoyl-CoA hydratase/carnithine racemase